MVVLELKELFIVISLLVSGFVLVSGSWWFSVDYLYTLDLIEKDNPLVPYFWVFSHIDCTVPHQLNSSSQTLSLGPDAQGSHTKH